jgi:hypothetical protein
MPIDLSKLFVVGISLRALFHLEEENHIFEAQGLRAFSQYQLDQVLLPVSNPFQSSIFRAHCA